jgi:Ni/Co efflux regulator RcnB
MMRRTVLAILVLASAAFALPGVASAGGVTIGAGPGGVYIGTHDRDYWRHRHWRHRYDRDCRVVVTHRWRHGERITVRRQICD